MTEEKDKPLDQQIKEAELAKLKAETADVEKRSKQARVMGVPLVQILFGGIVVGFVLLNYIQPLVKLNTDINTKEKEYNRIELGLRNKILEARADTLMQLADSLDTEKRQLASLNDLLKQETKDLKKKNQSAEENLANVQKRIAALNAQEKELQVKVIITKAFPRLDGDAEYSNALKQYKMIKAKNYYDRNLNPEGQGIDNQFQPQPGDSVIIDAATGLTWQQSGSGYGSYADGEDYLKKINAETYGGYKDWWLPTLEEAMSLMEPERKRRLYIAEQFDAEQRFILTSDKLSASSAWYVYFFNGYCNVNHVFILYYVRAVR